MRWALGTLLLLAIAITCYATPSQLAGIPSADIAKPGVMSLGFSAKGKSGNEDVTKTTELLVGFKRFECGVDVAAEPGSSVGNFKISVLEGGRNRLSLAVGMMDICQNEAADINRAYLTAGQRFGGVKLVVGVAQATGSAIKTDKKQGLIGMAADLNAGWWIAADYAGGESSLGKATYAIRKSFGTGRSLKLSYNVSNDETRPNGWSLKYKVDF